MTTLPDSLVRYGAQLERAIEREQRGRRRRRGAFRLAAGATAAAAATAVLAAALPGVDALVSPPRASAAERAAAVLSAGAIMHDVATYRHVAADGSVATWRVETWRQTSRPYARREITTRDGSTVETATTGARPAQLYDPAANTIYTNPPDGGPALGTPMPATDGDPLRKQIIGLLRDAHTVNRGATIRFTYANGGVEYTYAVDGRTYRPQRLTAATADGGKTTTRFETYEPLDDEALLSLRAQHPGAAVDRTEAGYARAMARR